MEQSQARFVEIATELIGAKAAAEFLREAWDFASDDVKTKLADALVENVVAQCKKPKDSFNHDPVSMAISKVIAEDVEKIVREKLRTTEFNIAARVDERVREVVERQVHEMTSHVVNTLAREILDRAKNKLPSIWG